MTPEDERLAWEALGRLESGEEVSLMVGNGPRPMEVKMTMGAKAFIAALVAASLRDELDPPPVAPAQAMEAPLAEDKQDDLPGAAEAASAARRSSGAPSGVQAPAGAGAHVRTE